MGVFGTFSASRFSQETANSFLEGLKRKLEQEVKQQQELERMRQQFEFNKELAGQQGDINKNLAILRGDIDRQNALFGEMLRLRGQLAQKGYSAEQLKPIDQLITGIAQGTTPSAEDINTALNAVAAGYAQTADKEWLLQNSERLARFITDPNDADAFIKAINSGDVAKAREIGIKAGIPFSQAELEQRQAQAGITKLEYNFLDDTYATRVAMEEAKKRGIELSNDKAKQDLEQAATRFEWEAERFGWDKRLFELNEEAKKLANEMTGLQIAILNENRPLERERLELDLQERRKRLSQMDLDYKAKELDLILKKQAIDANDLQVGASFMRTVRELANEDPNLARSYLDGNKDKLKELGFSVDSLDAYLTNVERLKKYEDPQRREALALVDMALKTPPTAGMTPDEMEVQLGQIAEALDKAGIDENIKQSLLDGVRRAWAGALSNLDLENLKLQLEYAKLNKQGQDDYLKVLGIRRQALADADRNLDRERDTVMKQLQASGCTIDPMTALVVVSGGVGAQLPVECTSEVARPLINRLAEIEREQTALRDAMYSIANFSYQREVAPAANTVSSPTSKSPYLQRGTPEYENALNKANELLNRRYENVGAPVPVDDARSLLSGLNLPPGDVEAIIRAGQKYGRISTYPLSGFKDTLAALKKRGVTIVSDAWVREMAPLVGVPYEQLKSAVAKSGFSVSAGEGDMAFRKWVRESREKNPIVR